MKEEYIVEETLFKDIRLWIYQNARNIELCLWKYLFENGDQESVLLALANYQNEDGGFGHGLEPDNWNPNSTPITTQHALKILKLIDFWDMQHPVYEGIWNYLNSEKDLLEYGWRFTIPSNDNYPHAPWWNYNEERNKKEYVGVTAEFTAFILMFGNKDTALYEKALKLTDELIKKLMLNEEYGNMGLEGYITLIDAIKKAKLMEYDIDLLTDVLAAKVKGSIEHDVTKWQYYGVRPSSYIRDPGSVFYKDNADIVNQELQYLINTKPNNGVWGITWTWFDNMEKYRSEFAISENWWKAYGAIEKMLFLRNFTNE